MITAEEIVSLKSESVITVPQTATIHDALKIMNERKIGAILVTDDSNSVVGIWTERDLMQDIVLPEYDIHSAKIGDYMTRVLIAASSMDSVYQLLDKFLGHRFRHILVEKDGEYIGFLSMGDVAKAILFEKDTEIKQLNQMISFEYYENWQWKSKKAPR